MARATFESLSMAAKTAFTPCCLATRATGVKAVLPRGIEVSRTPTFPPSLSNARSALVAPREDVGEMPYP